jgi:phosphatidylinositol dimannoside acyltransferase
VTSAALSSPVAEQPASPERRGSLRGRLAARGLGLLSAVLVRLPDRLLHRLADALGGLLYRLQPARRRLVRANLVRVVAYLAGRGLGGPRVAAAANDERSLERLVRSAFGHYLRSYLESLTVERYTASDLAERLSADDEVLARGIFGPAGQPTGRSLVLVGLHFGAIEIPALWTTQQGIRLTSPMETLSDPELQRFILSRRAASGLNLIPVSGAHRELRQRLAAGESVAIVSDRLVAGSGARVELFGAPARLPIGPAVLAFESGAPAWAVAVRRTGFGSYRARLERVEMPADGPRRERLAAFMANQARVFEQLIADAPEQWWTLFFPIWEHGTEKADD